MTHRTERFGADIKSAPLNFKEIAETALFSARSLLPHWLPGGRWEGEEYVARNPTRADEHAGSFKINARSGVWSDFATGDARVDLKLQFSHDRMQGDALDAIRTCIFDAAFLDIDLNGDSGLQVATALQLKTIPFAFVSGNGHAVSKDFEYVRLVNKPVEPSVVKALAREHCGLSELGVD